jgi:S-DNA-T family DNA segregation ATPase FtsK/SpoIIIE
MCGGTGNPEHDMPGTTPIPPEGFDAEDEKQYQEALSYINEIGVVSVSAIQRKLHLGYGRAARIIERMKKEGVLPRAEQQTREG